MCSRLNHPLLLSINICNVRFVHVYKHNISGLLMEYYISLNVPIYTNVLNNEKYSFPEIKYFVKENHDPKVLSLIYFILSCFQPF